MSEHKGDWRDVVGIYELKRPPEDIIRDLRDGWPDVFEDRNCRTCKWWGGSEEGIWRRCRKTETGVYGRPMHEDTLALAHSLVAPDCESVLLSKAGYGCPMWEAKEVSDE